MFKLKENVHNFWDNASCGELLYLKNNSKESYQLQANKRYELEPYILEFADFHAARNKKVLEIGVGLAACRT